MYRRSDFETSFRRYYRALCYFAFGFLNDVDEAEDAVQSVFAKMLDKHYQFETDEHLKYFLFKSVRNACINAVKTSRMRLDPLIAVEEGTAIEDEDFFTEIVRADIYREILAAVDSLPPQRGAIFRMAHIEGLSNDEIADRLSLRVNTVKSQKNKAKLQLREKLKGLYPFAT